MKVKRFQQGGEMAPQGPEGGQPQGGPGPEEQIAQMAQQIIQQVGPEAAAMLAQAIMEMLQGGAQQGQPQGQPTFARKGGKLSSVKK